MIPRGTTPSKSTDDILVQAYNKIKHGFTVTENLTGHNDLSSPYFIEYGRYGLTPESLKRLVDETVTIAGAFAELGALVYHLDADGLLP